MKQYMVFFYSATLHCHYLYRKYYKEKTDMNLQREAFYEAEIHAESIKRHHR